MIQVIETAQRATGTRADSIENNQPDYTGTILLPDNET